MFISLVVATVGRTAELGRLLGSLVQQTHKDFEVIVIDQNPDDRLVVTLKMYSKELDVTYRKEPHRGVSRARNIGASLAQGEILAFPDDDCWYEPQLLDRVRSFFKDAPEYAGLTGRVVDERGTPSTGRWDIDAGDINKFNEWTRSAEATLFLRQTTFERVGGFDSNLGPGSGTPWGACEGDDLILRVLSFGHRIYYDPALNIYHKNTRALNETASLLKAHAYARGMGRVMRMHKYPLWFVGYYCMRSLGGALHAHLTGDQTRARYFLSTFKGRIAGWLSKH